MKDNNLGWLALMVLMALMAGMFTKACIEYNQAKSLPIPPDFTEAEIRQRERDYIGDHLQRCKVCGTIDAEYDLENYCAEYVRLCSEAHIVGDWCYIGVVKKTGRVMWEYVGRPHPGWVWSELLQCWRQVRNYR